jgi:hypothetical protein
VRVARVGRAHMRATLVKLRNESLKLDGEKLLIKSRNQIGYAPPAIRGGWP